MKWIVASVATVLLMAALPWAITAAKASVRGKGVASGAMLSIGLAFSAIFDPKIAAATENIERKREIGDAEEGPSGNPPAGSNQE